MKTIKLKKILSVVLLVLMGTSVFAVNPVVQFTGSKKLSVKFDNVNEDVQLRIKDASGLILFSESIEKSSANYLKTFDISTLPDGNYQIELEGQLKVVSFPFSIEDDKITSSMVEQNVTYKPFVWEKGNKVYVSKFNPEKADLNIAILNKSGDVIYSETLKDEAQLGRIYNFSKTKGEFQISMSYNEKTYTQNVSIK
jgi:flagellar hook assembly protein FlgD